MQSTSNMFLLPPGVFFFSSAAFSVISMLFTNIQQNPAMF